LLFSNWILKGIFFYFRDFCGVSSKAAEILDVGNRQIRRYEKC